MKNISFLLESNVNLHNISGCLGITVVCVNLHCTAFDILFLNKAKCTAISAGLFVGIISRMTRLLVVKAKQE